MRLWVKDTAIAWLLLALAVVGTKDALDRGGWDYGERALAASAFGISFLAMQVADRLRLPSWTPIPRGVERTVAAAVVVATGALGGSQSIPSAAEGVLPAEFSEVASVVPVGSGCVYTLTSEGLWYFVLQRPSCSAYHQVAYARPESAQDEVIADLAAKRPAVIVYSHTGGFESFDGLSAASTTAKVTRWVLANYRPHWLIGGAWVWDRADQPMVLPPIADADAGSLGQIQVESGTEAQLEGSVAGGAAIGSGWGVVASVNGAAVAAAPIGIDRPDGWHLRIPTFDLPVGLTSVGIWLYPTSGARPTLLEVAQLDVRQRTARLTLGGD
jgi:hypothetical protein